MKKYLIAAAMAASLASSAHAWQQQPYDWQAAQWQSQWQAEMDRQRMERQRDRAQEHLWLMQQEQRQYEQRRRDPFIPWWAQ